MPFRVDRSLLLPIGHLTHLPRAPCRKQLPTINTTFLHVQNNNVMQYLLIYHFFGLLWTNQFIQVTRPLCGPATRMLVVV